jgi:hypothetical protein
VFYVSRKSIYNGQSLVDESALKLTCEHLGLQRFSGGDTPESPWGGRDRGRGGEGNGGREGSE